MKLKKLTIHNLASIEDAVIDFEHGPLAEDSRFLICGPTGAGKTTLLDAICLVLYGTTPRLKGSANESYVDTNENFTLKSRDDIKIDDTRMLMRRGSLEAYVELLFTDKDEHVLKAVWECSRVRNKAEGNIKEPEWKLSEEDDTLISSKKTEVMSLIAGRIGLSFEQFCRTTMLAQGDFTKFLKSGEGDKSEILEKLTGTSIYSDISKRIYAVSSEKRNACKTIEGQLGGVQLLTDEKQEEILQQQQTLQDNLLQLGREEKQLAEIVQWLVQFDQLKQLSANAAADYEKQQQQMNSDAYLRNKQAIDDWDRTLTQRGLWKDRVEADRTLKESSEEGKRLRQRYLELRNRLSALQQQEAGLEDRKERIVKYLSDEKERENSYLNISLIESEAVQFTNLSTQITHSKEIIATRKKEQMQLEENLVSQKALVESVQTGVSTLQKAIEVAVQQLEALNYNELLNSQRSLNKQQTDLKDYRRLTEQCEQSHTVTVEKQKALQTVQQLVDEYTRKVAAAEQQTTIIEQQMYEQEKLYEKQKLACDDLIKEYRSRLSVGDICPLCGQPVTTLTSDEHFVSILQPVKESLDLLRNRWNESGKLLAEQKASLAANQNEVERKKREQTLAVELENAALQKRNAHELFVRYQSSDKTLEEIDQALIELQLQLNELEDKLKEVGIRRQKVNELQQKKNEEDQKLRKAENQVTSTEKLKLQVVENLNAEQALLKTGNKNLSDKEKMLQQYIDLVRFHSEGADYIAILKKGAVNYQLAGKQLQQVELELKQLNGELRLISQSKQVIDSKQEEWQSLPKTVSSTSSQDTVVTDQLSGCWVDLQTAVTLNEEIRCKATRVKEEADCALKDYFATQGAVSEDRLSELVTHPSDQIESVRQRLQTMREELVRSKAQKETADKHLQRHLKVRPEMEEEMTLDNRRRQLEAKKEEVNATNRRLGQFTQSLEEDRKNRLRFESIRLRLVEAQKESDRWDRFSQLFGSADGKKFRNIAQSYVLEQLLISSNQYLQQFTDRYEMVCQPGSLTILLRDKEAGGVLRPTSTISGGESFLISLSLALGLSSLSRASVSMDTLFIDEGFGTLDSTYLSAVMDALERLHQINGKHIGIISHVESLKERLTTQIQVSRVNNTLSKVEIVSLI